MSSANEFAPELSGAGTGLANWAVNVSAPRQVMFGGHIGQTVVTKGAKIRNNLTGSEREYGKYVFRRTFRHDVRVEKVIDKIPAGIGLGRAPMENPLRTVIYRERGTHRVGVLDIPLYHSRHQSYGYRNSLTKAYSQLGREEFFEAGTVLSNSPNVREAGAWAYGMEANVVFLTLPATIEDGFVASEEFLEANTYTAVKNSVVSWGGKYVALNLYGDENNYKPYPDIGERVKSHGILMALRKIDDNLSIVELTPKALMTVDYEFDRRIYAAPGATVTDIDILHNVNNNKVRSLVGTETQPKRYYERMCSYYRGILDTYENMKREARRNKVELSLTPEFSALVVKAKERSQHSNAKLVYRNAELDDFRVEITYSYDIVPTIGNKFTGTHGDKGVIVEVRKRADMPRDQWGNYADLILDGDSTIKRMNPGRLFEQYLNTASRHVRQDVLKMLDAGKKHEAWEYLYEYYSVASSAMKKMMDAYLEQEDRKGPGRKQDAIDYHLKSIVEDDIKLFVPINLPEIGIDQIRNIKNSKFAPPVGPVTFRGKRGNWVTSRDNTFVGSMYIIMLEKTGDDWSAVSSPKLQHFGIPAKLTRADKLATPGHEQPVRFLGEDEVRLIAAFCGGDVVAELLDQTNSPMKHRAIVTTIARHPTPMNIHDVAPPETVVLGKNRAVEFVKHLLRCSGVRFVYNPTPVVNYKEAA